MFKEEYRIRNHGASMQEPAEAVFCIGSLTKMFTACAILLLEEQKQLRTGDYIEPFFPECPQAKKITIHRLLSHTSGMINYTDCEEIWSLRTKEISPAELINAFIKKPLRFSPGSQYSYCNSGYILLGSIIEQVSKLTYSAFLKQYIFDPLHMFSTQYGLPAKKRRIKGYSLTEGRKRVEAPFHHPSFAYAAGGIYSTIEDLLLWDQQLFTHQLLAPESLNKMLNIHCFTNAEQTAGYGYGLNVEWLTHHNHLIKHI